MTDTSRVFLVVVDESPEVGVAIMYACLRAKHAGGRVALLRVVTPDDDHFGSWMGVGDRMRDEALDEAEILVGIIADRIRNRYGLDPLVFIREGEAAEQLVKLITEERSISILVLATSPGPDGPGPLCRFILTRKGQQLRLPVTLVPGVLTKEEIEAIT